MAMNNKNTPSGKSLKMSADDLKEMVKAAVAECLGEEKEDTPPAEETAGEGMDVMSVIEEAVEAAAEKRRARPPRPPPPARLRSAPQPPRSASTRTSICPAKSSPSRRRKSPPTCSSPAL